jgi:hypothetical protein
MSQETSYQKASEATIDDGHGWRGIERMVDVVGNVCSESPVVNAVFEQIPQRHGSVRESMNENRLKETLGIVNCVTGRSNAES